MPFQIFLEVMLMKYDYPKLLMELRGHLKDLLQYERLQRRYAYQLSIYRINKKDSTS